jgi:cytochrome c-type biogenesis protein
MIEAILGMLETSAWLAVLGAALWGVASVLLSPCHLASIPLLVGFLGRLEGQTLGSRKLALWVTIGVSISLVVVAGISLAAGRILGDLWGIGPWLMVAFLIFAGLVLLDAINVPSVGQLRPERARAGSAGAAAAGGVLGVTLGPCTFAFFAPLIAFGAGPASLGLRATALAAFVAAHLLATWTAGILGARVGGWIQHGSRVAKAAKSLAGLAAIAIAIDMIVNAP